MAKQISIIIFILLSLCSCKSKEKLIETSTDSLRTESLKDSLWRTTFTVSDVSVGDSSILTIFYPDGTKQAEKRTYHSEKRHEEIADTTSQVKKDESTAKVTTKTKEKVVTKPSEPTLCQKTKYALIGSLIALVFVIVIVFVCIWKHK